MLAGLAHDEAAEVGDAEVVGVVAAAVEQVPASIEDRSGGQRAPASITRTHTRNAFRLRYGAWTEIDALVISQLEAVRARVAIG